MTIVPELVSWLKGGRGHDSCGELPRFIPLLKYCAPKISQAMHSAPVERGMEGLENGASRISQDVLINSLEPLTLR
jgi:hypothetical protein